MEPTWQYKYLRNVCCIFCLPSAGRGGFSGTGPGSGSLVDKARDKSPEPTMMAKEDFISTAYGKPEAELLLHDLQRAAFIP